MKRTLTPSQIKTKQIQSLGVLKRRNRAAKRLMLLGSIKTRRRVVPTNEDLAAGNYMKLHIWGTSLVKEREYISKEQLDHVIAEMHMLSGLVHLTKRTE